MKPRLAAITYFAILLGVFAPGSAVSQTPAPGTSSVSPDKRWRYIGDDSPKLVNIATSAVAVELEGHDYSLPVWAPDSKQFAIPYAGGKGSSTSVYQLHDGKWETGEVLGNGDEIMDQASNIIQAQAKKKGMPKNTFLHMNSWTVEPKKWLDASTLVVYAAMSEVAHRKNGEYAGVGYGTDLLLTLKFDAKGAWQIVKTHQMSEKEAKQMQAAAH